MVQKPFEDLTIADDTAKQCTSCTLLSYEMICFYLPVDVVLLSDGIRGGRQQVDDKREEILNKEEPR